MARPVDDLLGFLASPAPIPRERLEDIIDANPCKRKVSAGSYGVTYSLGTAFDGTRCRDVVLVKILKDDSEIDSFIEEGQVQTQIYKFLRYSDAASQTVNARYLVPAPIKQQDQYFFMEFVPNSYTLLASLTSVTSKYFKSIIYQIASFFALCEELQPDIRHTDLHLRNILVSRRDPVFMELYGVRLNSVFAAIIDFGLATINGKLPLDIILLLLLIVFDRSVLVESASGDAKLAEYADDIWRVILRPLFAPFMEDPALKPNSQSTNFFIIIEYMYGFRSSIMFALALQEKLTAEGWILPGFDIEFAPIPDRKELKFASRQVVELIKTW